MVKYFLVGGTVRDKLMGLVPKDLDYAVECSSYEEMRQSILDRGGKLYLEKPEYLTIRAKIPGLGDADFTACRKEGAYSDCRHPDSVEMGTIYEDLSRRDCRCNAIAQDEQGNYIDPYNGREDIKYRILRCVGSTNERFREDALRILRVMRFCITKDFRMSEEIEEAMFDSNLIKLLWTISQERIREELHKCFAHDTLSTLEMLQTFPLIAPIVFSSIWLKPTTEGK